VRDEACAERGLDIGCAVRGNPKLAILDNGGSSYLAHAGGAHYHDTVFAHDCGFSKSSDNWGYWMLQKLGAMELRDERLPHHSFMLAEFRRRWTLMFRFERRQRPTGTQEYTIIAHSNGAQC
jgi:hypothetical protein